MRGVNARMLVKPFAEHESFSLFGSSLTRPETGYANEKYETADLSIQLQKVAHQESKAHAPI